MTDESKIEKYKSNSTIRKQLEFVIDLAENHKEIAESISKYTYDEKFYKTMNTNLLRKKRQPKEIQVDLNNIDEAFKAVPPLTEPLVVYRGKQKDEVSKVDPSFVSTSLFSEVTKTFTGVGCCILKITVSPGSKVLPIYDLSRLRSEYEILLDRGGHFVVTGSEIIRDITAIIEGGDMKTIYVMYIPKIFEQTTLLSEIVDPEKLDDTQIQESVIAYFTGMKLRYKSEEQFDIHLNKLVEEENLILSPETIDAIKMRLGVSKACVIRSKEMFCKKEVPSQFPEDILKLTIENVDTPITASLPSNLGVLIFKHNSVPLPPLSHTKLTFLDCNNNSLDELPEVPSSLEVLHCRDNNLTTLPDLSHTKLNFLDITDNYIKKLPPLPPTVKNGIFGTTLQKEEDTITEIEPYTIPELQVPPTVYEKTDYDQYFK